MGFIPEEIVAQVIDRCDIVDLISSYVPLKRAGRNFKTNCPFHHEKTPSFVVNPDKQIFHCFGCGVGGNVVGFVMKHDRLEFPEAIRMLAQKVNVTIPETKRPGDRTANVRQLIFDVNALAARYFHENLISDKGKPALEARTYLKKRKVGLETVKRFQLGFAADRWDGLIKYLRAQGTRPELMEQAGLIIPRDQGGGYYDRFRNRIIFPIADTQAHCRAFGARALSSGSGEDKTTAKYINSPETPVYTKGHHLYGFHLAKQAIGQEDCAIIVEGYMDCIMPYQAGVANVVASLGTALTVEQIRLLRRYTKNVVMLFDMDAAGESAIMRSLDTLVEEGMDVKVGALDEGHDPDSFVRQYGGDAFREKIRQARTLFDYKLGVLMNRYEAGAIEGKVRISGEMLRTVDKFGNAVLRAEYVKRLAGALAVPEQALVTELKKVRQMTGGKKGFGRDGGPKTPVQEQLRVVESDILKLLLEEKSFVEATKKEIAPSDFRDERIRKVISRIYDLVEQGKEVNSASLINSFEDEAIRHMIARLTANEGMAAGDKEKMHRDYINRMKKDRVKRQMKELQGQIRDAEREADQSRIKMLLEQYSRLMKEVVL